MSLRGSLVVQLKTLRLLNRVMQNIPIFGATSYAQVSLVCLL